MNNNNKNRIAVLLSTYNGERFITQLLDSIFNQSCVETHVYIRDDGSTDNTLEIINSYNSKDITIIKGMNVGAAISFMELIYEESINGYSFYALADQDDIWLPDKLITAVDLLKQYNDKNPLLYACNQRLIDDKGNDMGNRLPDDFSTPSIYNIIFGNNLSGCTMVFNDNLRNELIEKKVSREVLNIRMHDLWIAAVAALKGRIIYDKNPHILFRRHGNNSSDGRSSYEIRGNRKIIDYLYAIKHSPKKPASMVAEEILRLYKNDLLETDEYKLRLLANYYRYFIYKIVLLFNKELIREWGTSKATYFGKILLNRM